MQIECMRAEVKTGASTYPVYIGFASAGEIAKVSIAPAFNLNTSHQKIAENISVHPVRDWQRPLSEERVDRIADAFNDTGRLMPNPVLLAKNAFAGGVTVAPKTIQGFPTGQFVVTIAEDAEAPEERPLWILDGQHRITGLSRSLQSANSVPVVLLLDDAAGAYPSPLLASIFAQVTTAATKLDELHNEWLTYAFELGRYSNAPQARTAFASVVELCRTPSWGAVTNPFFNEVQFNEHKTQVQPRSGGFAFTCKELSAIFEREYYISPSQIPHLAPAELAREIALAYTALHKNIQGHATSVFFHADKKKQQRIVQESYIVGILTRLLAHGPTANYDDLLQKLNFQQTNWELSWVRGLSGRANAVSKRIAIEVFGDALLNGMLPVGSNNLADYLRGNGASVTLSCSRVNPSTDRPTSVGRTKYLALRGATGSHPVSTTPHVKASEKTSNVGEFQIIDATQRGRPIFYNEMAKRGLLLTGDLPRPLEIVIAMQHYGETFSQSEVSLNW